MIEDSKILIIDLSEDNPNVFLELGVAYSLNKPMVIICSEVGFKEWQTKSGLPFDIQGRELLIFRNEDDLKVKLGRYIFDVLYKTREVSLSWNSIKPDNHIKSPTEIDIFNKGGIWSADGIHYYFAISCHIEIIEVWKEDRNPDMRMYISHEQDGYPRIIVIFPWEISELEPNKYECHIDYHPSKNNIVERLQQIVVGEGDFSKVRNLDLFLSFSWPNLVFESSFFIDKVTRLMVSKSYFQQKGYPIHLSQYIGFESINSRITISDIRVKEHYLI
jgi:hypothetical protein